MKFPFKPSNLKTKRVLIPRKVDSTVIPISRSYGMSMLQSHARMEGYNSLRDYQTMLEKNAISQEQALVNAYHGIPIKTTIQEKKKRIGIKAAGCVATLGFCFGLLYFTNSPVKSLDNHLQADIKKLANLQTIIGHYDRIGDSEPNCLTMCNYGKILAKYQARETIRGLERKTFSD